MPTKRPKDKTQSLLREVSRVRANAVGSEALYYMNAIDTKTSSLLAHLSIMIAAVGVFYGFATKGSITRAFLGVEILVYMLMTLGCLVSISIIRPRALPGATTGELVRLRVAQVRIRLWFYNASRVGTIGTTIAFVLTVAFHLKDDFQALSAEAGSAAQHSNAQPVVGTQRPASSP